MMAPTKANPVTTVMPPGLWRKSIIENVLTGTLTMSGVEFE
jgi:hypothetical protein